MPTYHSSKYLIPSLEEPCKLAAGIFVLNFDRNVADPTSGNLQYRYKPEMIVPSLESNDLKVVGGGVVSVIVYWENSLSKILYENG